MDGDNIDKYIYCSVSDQDFGKLTVELTANKALSLVLQESEEEDKIQK